VKLRITVGAAQRIYPEKIVCPLNFKRLSAAFSFKFNFENDCFDIFKIENKNSHYFRYLYQLSV